MYKNYIFDLYGTLVDIEVDENKDELWEKMALFYSFYGAKYDPEDLKSKYYKFIDRMVENAPNPATAEIDVEVVFYQLFKKKNVKPKNKMAREAARIFRLLSLERLELYPYTLSVLNKLKEDGKRVYLLTNAQSCHTRNELKGLGLDELFDGIYISSELGVKKPAKKAIETLLDQEKLNRKKTVMIGNEYATDIESAKKAGIDSVFLKSNIFDEESKVVKSTYQIMSGDLREVFALDEY